MPAYRLYFLDANGTIRRALELACRTDEEALARAVAHLDGGAMELWDRDRVVRKFAAGEVISGVARAAAAKGEQRGAG